MSKPPCGKCGAPIDECFFIMLCDKCLDKLLERTDAAKAAGEKVKLTDEEFFEMFGGAPKGEN